LGEASPPESLEAGDERSRRCIDEGGVAQTGGAIVSEEQLEEMGPIDYVVLEWKGEQPDAGEVQPLLLDLVDRGIIRTLDIAFLAKDQDLPIQAILAAIDPLEASNRQESRSRTRRTPLRPKRHPHQMSSSSSRTWQPRPEDDRQHGNHPHRMMPAHPGGR
jgi:hypothetical protein